VKVTHDKASNFETSPVFYFEIKTIPIPMPIGRLKTGAMIEDVEPDILCSPEKVR